MICVSLAGISFEECLASINKLNITEIRIDKLDFTTEQFNILFSQPYKTVATCRPGTISEDARKNMLNMAIESGATYVDIEYETDNLFRRELIEHAFNKNTKVIISYHDFQSTPSKKELETIIDKSFIWGADLVKIVTTANVKKDNAIILSLYENYNNIIAFCMGDLGKVTRLAAPLLGAEFTYASLNDKNVVASGQISVEDMEEIYKKLRIN
jgi:3-dehydroquinate dehydratase I